MRFKNSELRCLSIRSLQQNSLVITTYCQPPSYEQLFDNQRRFITLTTSHFNAHVAIGHGPNAHAPTFSTSGFWLFFPVYFVVRFYLPRKHNESERAIYGYMRPTMELPYAADLFRGLGLAYQVTIDLIAEFALICLKKMHDLTIYNTTVSSPEQTEQEQSLADDDDGNKIYGSNFIKQHS